MNMTYKNRLATNLLFSAASLLVLSTAATAQEQSSTPKSTVLEEILVTANRREESLQEVSASVTAFSMADIEHKGFDGFSDFAGSVPGLTLNESVRNRGSFNIRGVALNVTGANTQDPVSIYINDTPVSDTFGAIVVPDLRLFDVERIEVLRGPQGTLFGSGSLGGTVRIITHKPDATKTEAAGRVDFGQTEGGALRQRYDAMINVPLIDDQLAVRAVGYYRDEEGWVKNITLGTKNSTEDWGGRVSLLWTPNEAWSVKAEVIHQDSDPEDGDSWNPQLGKFKKSSAIGEGRKAELTNYSLTVAYDAADFATLSSITTYQESKSASIGDSGDLFGVGLPVIGNSDPWNSKFFVQELRLVSNTQSRLEWVAGAFFIDRETFADFLIEVPGLNQMLGGAIGSDAFFASPITTGSQEIALYGDVTFKLTDALKLNASLRKFRTEASYSEPNRNVLDFATFTYVHSSFKNEGEDSDYTWRAGLSYDVSDRAMVYGNLSKGYRVGQVNPNNGPSFVDPSDIVIPEGYAADSTLNYEIGAKTAWLEQRLVANLAVYYIDWRDIQIDGQRVSDNRSFITNAGAARSQGAELELSLRATDGLTLYTALTFQDAEITEVPTNIIVPAARGDVLPGLVKFKFSGGFEYRWDLGVNQLYVRADGQYVDSSPNGLRGDGTNPYYAINASYENVDAAIGWVTRWGEVALYGENLTNNDAYILNAGPPEMNPMNTLRPRTAGVRVNVKY
jgi:outer membrane receptor protein involved in Fe transport